MTEMKRIRPEFNDSYLRKHPKPVIDENGIDHIADGLIKAGLPDD